jgi:hypothetical protein
VDKQQLVFTARLSSVNSLLGRYIARLMNEADPLTRTEYTVPLVEMEREVGVELVELARVILTESAGRTCETATMVERAPRPGRTFGDTTYREERSTT